MPISNARFTTQSHWLWVVALLLLGNVCFAAPMQLRSGLYSQLPGWAQDRVEYALPALKQSCQKILSRARYRSANQDPRATRAWLDACRAINRAPNHLNAEQTRSLIATHFVPYAVTYKGSHTGLFTGYYEPTIPGSLNKTAFFSTPVYGMPRNLKRIRLSNGQQVYRLNINGRIIKMPARAEIERGALLHNTPVLAWIHSKVDRFFLQIQGSGSITLTNGKRLLLGYAGQNGHRYFPIGKYLVSSDKIPANKISMQSIRQWFKDHPSQAQRVMNMNPSFVFFRPLDVNQPIGAQGIPLTPGRSLAVDRRFIKLGTPIWLSTYLPKPTTSGLKRGANLQRLMVAQDTGGAIKNAIRGDVFWGSGKQAQFYAGHMQSQGRYWLLLPIGISPKIYKR